MCRLEMHGTRSVPTTMAGFQTHITVSTLAGVGYGVWGYSCGAPVQTCVLAGGLCSVSGMLPDLDSESGRPVQEISCFAAAVVPLEQLALSPQCGFASVASGNLLSEADQWRKLNRVAETARRVWS